MSKPKTNYNSFFIKAFKQSFVSYNPLMAELGGSATTGLFLCYLLFWWNKRRNRPTIYKTVKEVEADTCLSKSEQAVAVRRWIALGVLEKTLKGVPAKRHFKINLVQLTNLLVSRYGNRLSQDLLNQLAQFSQLNGSFEPTITESTPESTYRDTVLQTANTTPSVEFVRDALAIFSNLHD